MPLRALASFDTRPHSFLCDQTESDKCFFTTCWLYEEVLITWVERHSLVLPCPAVSSLVTIVLTVFLFRLASAFPASLTFCLQGTVSLVPFARTIDEPLYKF